MIFQLRMMHTMIYVMLFMVVAMAARKCRNRRMLSYAHQTLHRHQIRSLNLDKMVFESDRQSLVNCRMDRRTFAKLCHLVKTVRGLKETRNMSVEEMVVNFFHIIGHHTKNRVNKRQVVRSGETISKQFHAIQKSVLRLHLLLFKKDVPIGDNSTDSR
ncbi:hypothetical protein PTKIN_Ptkin08bG0038200 [Pterospermum kingtungense]